MKISHCLMGTVLGLVAIAACSSTDPVRTTVTERGAHVENCECNVCGCGGTGNQCTHNVCTYIGGGHYACIETNWSTATGCQDPANCIEQGHCNGSGSCSGYVGTGDVVYTCLSDNPNWTCGCSHDGSGYHCSDSNTPTHFTTPVPTTCGASTDNTYCQFTKRCQ